MKIQHYILFLLVLSISQYGKSLTTFLSSDDSTSVFEKGLKEVNQCTPWHHAKCVMITGTEVFEDSRDGKKVRHWWRMSYIGRACTAEHGKVFGTIFEGIWAIPHYTGVAVGSGFGYIVYAVKGPRNLEKVAARKQKRALRKEQKQ